MRKKIDKTYIEGDARTYATVEVQSGGEYMSGGAYPARILIMLRLQGALIEEGVDLTESDMAPAITLFRELADELEERLANYKGHLGSE